MKSRLGWVRGFLRDRVGMWNDNGVSSTSTTKISNLLYSRELAQFPTEKRAKNDRKWPKKGQKRPKMTKKKGQKRRK